MGFFIQPHVLETTVMANVAAVEAEIAAVKAKVAMVMSEVLSVVANFNPVVTDVVIVGAKTLGLCGGSDEDAGCE